MKRRESVSAALQGLALVIVTSMGAAWPQGTQAHHYFATEYENQEMISVSGVVEAVRFVNPHVQILVVVHGEEGSEEIWAANSVSPASVSHRGWTADTVMPGDAITLYGNRGRDGAKRLWIQTLTLTDASAIYPVGRTPAASSQPK